MMRRKHTERSVHVSLDALIASRLSEGYIIKDITISKGLYLWMNALMLTDLITCSSF